MLDMQKEYKMEINTLSMMSMKFKDKYTSIASILDEERKDRMITQNEHKLALEKTNYKLKNH